MSKAATIIKSEIEEFVKKNGGSYEEFYIGITNNLKRRIVEGMPEYLNEHLASGRYREGEDWYSEECETRDVAVAIEQYFQTEKGMQGYNASAIGKENSKFIYCFKQDHQFKTKQKVKKMVRGVINEVEKKKKIFPTFEEFKNNENI